jgi:hemoglobin
VTDEQRPERPATPYDDFGGEAFFARLVGAFYERVATDPILRPMYPDEDLDAAERRLRLFLMQYWGGPQTYSEERGHPRLRARHMDFRIDAAARDRWLSLMHDAMVEQDLTDDQESQLWMYLIQAAFAMQNVEDDPFSPPLPTEKA